MRPVSLHHVGPWRRGRETVNRLCLIGGIEVVVLLVVFRIGHLDVDFCKRLLLVCVVLDVFMASWAESGFSCDLDF